MTLAENPQQLSSGNKKPAFHKITYHFKNSLKPCIYRAFPFHLISLYFLVVSFSIGKFDGKALRLS